jgi:hypothetical protein
MHFVESLVGSPFEHAFVPGGTHDALLLERAVFG